MSEESPSYDEVLMPTDGSRRGERAVDHGVKLADLADAGGTEAPHMGSVTDRVLRTTDVPVFTV